MKTTFAVLATALALTACAPQESEDALPPENAPETPVEEPMALGDDEQLDALYEACEQENYTACVELFMASPPDSEYENLLDDVRTQDEFREAFVVFQVRNPETFGMDADNTENVERAFQSQTDEEIVATGQDMCNIVMASDAGGEGFFEFIQNEPDMEFARDEPEAYGYLFTASAFAFCPEAVDVVLPQDN